MVARILLKTTVGPVDDDWNIGRFSLLASHLCALKDESGSALYRVTAANRIETQFGDDVDLVTAPAGACDQLWLLAVDTTGLLTDTDVGRISIFRERGGGVFLSRDHQDPGACLTRLGGSAQPGTSRPSIPSRMGRARRHPHLRCMA